MRRQILIDWHDFVASVQRTNVRKLRFVCSVKEQTRELPCDINASELLAP
jgi:hypothetical protein